MAVPAARSKGRGAIQPTVYASTLAGEDSGMKEAMAGVQSSVAGMLRGDDVPGVSLCWPGSSPHIIIHAATDERPPSGAEAEVKTAAARSLVHWALRAVSLVRCTEYLPCSMRRYRISRRQRVHVSTSLSLLFDWPLVAMIVNEESTGMEEWEKGQGMVEDRKSVV